MSSSVEKKIEKLRKEIEKHNNNYYVLDKPTIPDADYDKLLLELERLEKENPQFITPDSPTQFVGNDLIESSETIKHRSPMLSIQNETDLNAFDKSIKKKIGAPELLEYVVELKIDGLSVNLNYVNGILKTAATRGDGEYGEDILDNVKTIKDIPQRLKIIDGYSNLLNDIEVRGEIYLSTDDFEIINEEQERLEKRIFANPRNLAAGIVKMKDAKLVAQKPLKNFAYTIISANGDFYSQEKNLELLKQLGFVVNNNAKKCYNIEEVIQTCNYFEKLRDKLPYQIDGAVVKVNLIEYQNVLGIGVKYSNWARAFKFPPEKKETILLDITWQVGRTGIITPVAELKPVRLAGSTIKRATLHNFDEITRKKLKIGDTVIIEKGGDVIPKVVSVIESKRPIDAITIKPPDKCPVCKSEVTKQEGEVAYYCDNPECLAQLKGRLVHFVSRSAMDIEGLGESIINQFVEMKYLLSFADIYKLKKKRAELIKLEGYGEKRVDNILQSIEKSKSQSFVKVLFALGIRKLGEVGAQIIAEKYDNITDITNSQILNDIIIYAKLKEKAKFINPRSKLNPCGSKIEKEQRSKEYNALREEIIQIGKELVNSGWYIKNKKGEYVLKDNDGIGPETAQSVLNFFKFSKGKKTIKELKAIGLFTKSIGQKGSILNGKTFVLTGTLPNLTRPQATDLILENGGKVASGFSKSADYVLAGDDAGEKLSKAKELEMDIISEKDFLVMINKVTQDSKKQIESSRLDQLDMFKN
jgi:DNA ligase (NAD+)